MALTEPVLLFHDRPPQGAGAAEIFEARPRSCAGRRDPAACGNAACDRRSRERTALLARRLRPALLLYAR